LANQVFGSVYTVNRPVEYANTNSMDNREIWRSAQRLVDLYGDDAVIQAATRADELLAGGVLDGAAAPQNVDG